MSSQHVVVVGAGIAGLTAAYRLQQAGHHVQVLESDAIVGGRMITIQWQGFSIDPGAEFITGADKFLLQMVRELGIQDKLINYSDQQTGFYVSVMRDNQVHRVNFMSIPSYLSWKGVSLGGRLAMLKLLPYMMRAGRADIYRPEEGPFEDTQGMEQFFYEKINGEMFEYWVQPTMDVFCGYTVDDLSAKMLLMLFGSYLSQKLYTFQGGIGFFPDTLASKLPVQFNAAVQRIEAAKGERGATIHYQTEGRPQKIDCDQVVVAVPGDAVLKLFESPKPAWQAFFSQVRYTRVGIVYHLIEGDDPALDEGGIMFPRKEPWKLSALGWKRRPDGRVLAMSDLKAHLYDLAMSDEALKNIITEEAVRAVPQFAGKIKDQMVFRWSRKVPAYPPGFLDALKLFRQNAQEGPVYFCGDYLIGPNTGAALASGWQCADRLLEKIGR